MSTSDRRAFDRRVGSRREADRRRPRLLVPGLPVRLLKANSSGQSIVNGRLVDISTTGIQLVVNGGVVKDDLILVEVRLKDGCLNLSAKVVRTRIQDDSQLLGCRLASPPAPEKLAILRRLTKTGQEE